MMARLMRVARPFFWWSEYGVFEAETNGLYPQASQVVAQYRRLSGWSRDQLASRLGIGAKAQYYAEYEGRGLDSVGRRRDLCTLLDIPSALLGLSEAPGPAGWWLKEYEPWPSGPDGWPDVRAVIKWYRRAKDWTQSDLSIALGITLSAVQNMENSGSSLDAISRRRALRFLLGIPPALLGLDTEHFTRELGGTLIGSAKGPAPELITSFRSSVGALFSGYYAGHAQDRVTETLSWLADAREVRAMTQGSQRLQMLEVESLGYQALANIEREHASDTVVFGYSNRAVKLARDSGNIDLLGAALQRRAETAFERGYVDLAQRSIREALPLNIQDPSEQLVRTVVACRILATGVSNEQDRSEARALIDQARPAVGLQDTFYRNCDNEGAILWRSQALNQLALYAPEAQARDFLRRSSDLLLPFAPATPRRSVRVKLTLAQSFAGLGEFDYAATIVLEALPLMDQIKSVLYLPQLAQIYDVLHKSKMRHDPRVVSLGLYLQEHGAL